MATIEATCLMDLDWQPEDRLELVVGTEGAVSLAASDPAGGMVLVSSSPWANGYGDGGFGADGFGDHPFGETSVGAGFGDGEFGDGSFGVTDALRPRLSARYTPADKSATLPVGLRIRDAQGNVSSVNEDVVQLADPPRAPRNVRTVDMETPGEVRLEWDASPDV